MGSLENVDGAPVQEKQIHVLDVSGILIFSASQILLLASVSLSDPNGFVSGGLHSNRYPEAWEKIWTDHPLEDTLKD